MLFLVLLNYLLQQSFHCYIIITIIIITIIYSVKSKIETQRYANTAGTLYSILSRTGLTRHAERKAHASMISTTLTSGTCALIRRRFIHPFHLNSQRHRRHSSCRQLSLSGLSTHLSVTLFLFFFKSTICNFVLHFPSCS